MRPATFSSDEILPLVLNMDDGSIAIGHIRMRPDGAGTDDIEIARDDGQAVFDLLRELRDEVFEWRIYAEKIRHLVESLPLPDGSKPCFDVSRLSRERDEAIRRAVKAEQALLELKRQANE